MANAVIFDVDGTLVDSVDVHAHAWQDAFLEFGYRIEFNKIRAQIGKGSDKLISEFVGQDRVTDTSQRLEKRRAEILKSRYLSQIVAFPNVRPLFKRLIANGVRIALASSAKSEELEHYKKIAAIDDLVDAETASEDADHSKPDPDIFAAALAKLGDVTLNAAVVVGDTPYDAEAAAKAGLRSIGLRCGGWPEIELRKAGCSEVYQDPTDLLRRYESASLFECS